MAEQDLMLSDVPFFPAQEVTNTLENSNSSDNVLNSTQNVGLSQETVTLDEFTGALRVTTKVESKDTNSNSNEESNVESPTTGESYVYKCVFCERTLTAADNPKLLECLHNTCGSCINNKLFEQNEGQGKNYIRSKDLYNKVIFC